MRFRVSCLALLAAGCAVPPPVGPSGARAVDGAIHHYVRSNRDGTEAENVVHFRPRRDEVAVYKWVGKCTTAAYVTAQFDPATWEARGLDAGKVARDGSQTRFGRIDLDPATRTVSAWVDLPAGRMGDTATLPAGMPWFLFDYDLGDLNVYLQERRPAADFTFAFALVWPESADFLTHMATIHAAHRGIEQRGGRPARRFDLHFVAGRPGSGTLWTDPETGTVIEAEASVPNHPGMTDFRLRLERSQSGGRAAWDALLRGHYSACPKA
ncbi:hypothetical protein [Sphingomonas mesophila]|uniref:hypothetical protein n=1 Tax=Sphingomonas mesophila TaxID=2303576 RepID=UPI000E587BC5|nr:hypothetical protein [Sphingomonas mesophila]